jgi:integrase
MKLYRVAWDRFAKWMEVTHPKITHLHEISPKMAEDYVSNLWAAGITPSTYNAHMSFLKSCFGILKTAAGLTMNPWIDIPRMQKSPESRRGLTTGEMRTVCSKATGSLRYMIALGIYTGLRLGDVTTLKWEEVDLESKIIERVPLKTRRTNKSVRFPIHPVLAAMLEELQEKAADPYLFPDEAKAYALDRSAISKKVNKFFKDCGIATTEASTDVHRKRSIARVGFHSLRHSFVSLCAANNVPQVAIMEMVGHGSPAMTRLYSHAGDAEKAKAIAALPDVSVEEKAPAKSKGKSRTGKGRSKRKRGAS